VIVKVGQKLLKKFNVHKLVNFYRLLYVKQEIDPEDLLGATGAQANSVFLAEVAL